MTTTEILITLAVGIIVGAISILALCKAAGKEPPKPSKRDRFPQTFDELEDAGFKVIQPKDKTTRDEIEKILKR